MKFYQPRHISLVSAAVITAAYLGVAGIGLAMAFPHAFIHPATTIGYLLLSAGAIYAITYFIYRYTIEQFIYSKIRLIYKTIHTFKSRKDQEPAPTTNPNILEDVSHEVKVWQEEKSREIEQLHQMEQYRREFIGNVSHELKNPITNIQGYVLTLLDGGINDPEINVEYLKRTEKSIERLIRIVGDLDEIAQLESGTLQLKITRFNIIELAREVIEAMEMKAENKGVRLILNASEKEIDVEADREKIRQVLTNLVSNSIRYGKHDGGRTKISFFDMDENILTEVTDDGIGIDEEDLPRVFERFYRTSRGRCASRKGKGLGLAIVKHILEAHQQTVNVRSTIGVGTTFGFTLKKA